MMNTNQIGNNEDSSLKRYYAELHTYPLISAEEEADLIKKIHGGDQLAMNKLVQANLKYVVSVARKFTSGRADLMELISEGNQGLFEAAKRFDGSSGNRFTTYATYWIQKFILEYLAQSNEAVYLPKHQTEALRRVKKLSAKFEQYHARPPRPHELADELGMEEEDVIFLLGLAQQTKAIDAPIKMGDGEEEISLRDLFHDEDAKGTDSKLVDESLTTDLANALNLLNDREKKVLTCFYGIGTDKLTQKEISENLNISPARVWQIKDRALHKLKVNGYDGDLQNYSEK